MLNAQQADTQSESMIPASQRPDGTWRKARRVKGGYVPQEEVPLYESKGKRFVNRQLTPANHSNGEIINHRMIPGLIIEVEEKPKKNKKKTKKVDEVTEKVQTLQIKEAAGKKKKVKEQTAPETAAPVVTDAAKKLKNLKKRLREVEALELKLKNGEIAKPEPDQLTKVKRKNDLIMEIEQLEKAL